MALLITNGCSFPKASLMFFCFDKIRDSALNISRSWEYQGYIRVKRIIFCLIHPYLLKYTAYQIEGGIAHSNLFDQFCCIASVSWMDGSTINAMHCGTWCERQDVKRFISCFPNIWHPWEKLGDSISILWGNLTGSWPEYLLHWEDIPLYW